jgi:hypothetical protein
MIEQAPDVSESDFFSRCVREFVQAQKPVARRAFITALTQYETSCDRDGRVVVEQPLGNDSRERRGHTDVAFTGTLSAQRIDLSLRLAYCGDAVSPDHITIVADGETWRSQRLEFARDSGGCDVAELPYTRSLGRALERVVESPEASVLFEGTTGELAITDPIRNELRVFLEALDATQR